MYAILHPFLPKPEIAILAPASSLLYKRDRPNRCKWVNGGKWATLPPTHHYKNLSSAPLRLSWVGKHLSSSSVNIRRFRRIKRYEERGTSTYFYVWTSSPPSLWSCFHGHDIVYTWKSKTTTGITVVKLSPG